MHRQDRQADIANFSDSGSLGSCAEGSLAQGPWHQEDLADTSAVEPLLPMIEECNTQLRPGRYSISASVVSSSETFLYRVKNNLKSLGISVLKPGYFALVVPLRWPGSYTVNGQPATGDAVYTTDGEDCFILRGDPRETMGIITPRSRLLETIGALGGRAPEDALIDNRPLRLPEAQMARLRAGLLSLMHRAGTRARTGLAGDGLESLERRAHFLLADAWVAGQPAALRALPSHRALRIVRRAEEYFLERMETGPVGLADICHATGAGKTTLYNAFQKICGEPPLVIYRRHRLAKARSLLLTAAPERGAVKRAATGAGLTELGRFAIEYRRLFGESPSETLRRSL